MKKWDLSDVITDHYKTFYNNRTKRAALGDWFVFAGIPVILGVLSVVFKVRLYNLSSVLDAVAILAGFLFALLLLLLQLAADSRKGGQGNVPFDFMRRINALREMRANVAYSALVALTTTALLGISEVLAKPQPTNQPQDAIPVALAVAVIVLVSHLLLTLLMVLKRTYRLITHELNFAAGGSEANSRPRAS